MAHPSPVDPSFGPRMRALRHQRGLSLRALEVKARSNRSSLSEYETGRTMPSADTARLIDDALAAGGVLSALVFATIRYDGESDKASAGYARAMDGRTVRHEPLHESPTGHHALPPDDVHRLAYVHRHPRRVDTATVDILADLLAGSRRLEDSVGPLAVLPAAQTQLAMITSLVASAGGPIRSKLVDVAAQWSQFLGWLCLATERHDDAVTHLHRALSWAVESGDHELTATVLSFQGHGAWLRAEPGPMIGLTEAALRDSSIYVGQRAYDMYQLARGHALVDDAAAAVNALAHADDLAGETAAFTGHRPSWHYYRSPAFFALEAALVHRLLGRHDRRHNAHAVHLFTTGMSGLDDTMAGAEWVVAYLIQLVLPTSGPAR